MLSRMAPVIVSDLVVETMTRARKYSIYMVFPCKEYGLAGLPEGPSVKLSTIQSTIYLRQLLTGTEYLHQNKILYRDLKAVNLLVNNHGLLQFSLVCPCMFAIP
ncbi:hypothetical protein BDV93DRAFT_587861 [Ceratobasidium sp. AG-I]|nr:hypothetical protein BDV93DRAFT_587861 [Ceratobasidium sp. AG-I]